MTSPNQELHLSQTSPLTVVGIGLSLLGLILLAMDFYEYRKFMNVLEGPGHHAILDKKRYEYVEKPKGRWNFDHHRYFMDFTWADEEGRHFHVTKGSIGLEKDTYDKYQEGEEVLIYVYELMGSSRVIIANEKEADRSFWKSKFRFLAGLLSVGLLLLAGPSILKRFG